MTDLTDGLVAFLHARLDEDEQKARASRPRPDDSTAGHDPARVLREVEAKRLILAEYENENRVMERGHRTAWTDGGQAARHTVLKAFALPYADHPDYNPDWRL